MRKEILTCDMCGKDLKDEPYWMFHGQTSGKVYITRDEIDLCPYCNVVLKNYMKQYRRCREDFDKLFKDDN